MDANVARSEVAKGLLDMACYDLMGQLAAAPACEFMGGRGADALPLAALIPLGDAASMVEMALAFQKGGTRTFRLKLGTGIEADRARDRAAREALGPEARLRVDYNQAYSAGRGGARDRGDRALRHRLRRAARARRRLARHGARAARASRCR